MIAVSVSLGELFQVVLFLQSFLLDKIIEFIRIKDAASASNCQ